MAKATAYCKCKVCGAEFTRTNTCGSRSLANDWEEWASDYYDLCEKCYAEEQREIERQKGLYIDVRLDSNSAFDEDSLPIAIIFGGDTKPLKETIKDLGARWTDEYPESGVFGDLLRMGRHVFKWVLWCTLENYEEKIKEAEKIGAKINSIPSDVDLALYSKIKQTQDTERNEKKEKLKAELEELGDIPAWSNEIMELWPKNAKWNGKIYGKAGRYSVYFSGVQVSLTDAQADLMKKTYELRQEWRNTKKQIESKYN